MSMIGNYRLVSPSQLDELLAHPETISDFLYADDDDASSEDRSLDIDKSWHLIHFLLTGDVGGGDAPLCDAVLGGTVLGTEDVGYGPARYLRPEEVLAVHNALATISPEELWSRFDAKAANEAGVYPQWEGSPDDREYICENFVCLKGFFEVAAAHGQAMLLYIN